MAERWRASIVRRFHTALGLSCPVCLLAVLVAISVGSIAVASIVLDRVRSLQQAQLTAITAADLARQRTAGLLRRVDAALQAAAEAAGATDSAATAPTDATKIARLDTSLAQQRRLQPGLLALAAVDASGQVISGASVPTLRTGELASSCLGRERPDADRVMLQSALAGQLDGDADLPVLCVIRGVRAPGFTGSVLAVIGADRLGSHYADLTIGPHGVIGLLDENGRLLARVAGGGAPGSTQGSTQTDEWARLARGGAPASDDGVIQTRRIDGPVPAYVVVDLAAQDVLAAWWTRSVQIGGGALIVIAFVMLAVIAVRRCEQREARRLERLAAMAAIRGLRSQDATNRDALTARLVEHARELVPCDAVPQERSQADPPPDDRLTLSIRQPGLVWIGPVALRRRHGAGFTAGDLAFLRVLAQLADRELREARARAAATEEAGQLRREANRQLQALDIVQGEMSDASFTLDQNWRFVAANRNADALFGEYSQDIRDRAIWELFPELTGSVFESECRRAMRDQHAVSFTLQWIRGDKWLMARAFPRPPGLAVYLQDISRQVAADENLRQSAKMEAIGRLTGGIAHDFNNLLTVILGNTEILEMELPEHGELREVHDQIKRAAQNAAELTHQLLAFARRQPLSPSDVDVGRLTLGLDGLLRRTLGSAVTVTITCPPTLWRARVDPTQLENAILNLAINARDAMPSGGKLTIEAANLTMRRVDVDPLGEIRPGNYVVVSVSDTGTGIPKDVIGKVFEPFFSTKPPGRGTGLGLSMVYGFATQSGGHARITSELGRGTTVRLYLPSAGLETAQPRGEPALGDGPRPPPPPGGRETILLVEDAEMVRDYATAVLTGLGYNVSAAADGRAALALLDRGLQPDLLLTDVLLPDGMDGLQVADQVMQRRPGIRVLYMSGYIENADATQSRLDPQTNLLLKPFHRAALAAMVRARLDRPN